MKEEKSLRNVSFRWDETKKMRSVRLTDTAWKLLEVLAQEEDANRSEMIERLARRAINSQNYSVET